MSEIADSTKVRFRKSGDLTIVEDNQPVIVAHYDRKSGHLEYASKDFATRYSNEVTTKIGTVANGTMPSANVVRSVGIKGEDRPTLKNVPKRPRMGELGDAGEVFVAWMLEHDMPQAIVRYGIFCDENGEPIKKKVRRIFENSVDNRNGLRDVPDAIPRKGGSAENGAIFRERYEEESEGYIARRATALTFTPSEVIGGWQPDDDDYNPHSAAGEETD